MRPVFEASLRLCARRDPEGGHPLERQYRLENGARLRLSGDLPHDPGTWWLLSAHLRTTHAAELRAPIPVRRASPVAAPQPSTWRVTGKVLRLDRAERLAVVRVYPERARLEPFVVSAVADLDLLASVEDAWYVTMQGILEGSALRLRQIESVQLAVPTRWRDWLPPNKREQARRWETYLARQQAAL